MSDKCRKTIKFIDRRSYPEIEINVQTIRLIGYRVQFSFTQSSTVSITVCNACSETQYKRILFNNKIKHYFHYY